MSFSEILNSLLNERGMKQVDLCRLSGLSSAQVTHLVKGRTKDPTLSTAVKIADALDVSLDYLAGRSVKPEIHLDGEERAIVRCYRESTPERRRALMQTAMDSAVLSKDKAERAVYGSEGASA